MNFSKFLMGTLLCGSIYAQRPHQPWVERHTINERPRQLVVALNQRLWLMYDLSYATLRLAWNGGSRGGSMVRANYINTRDAAGRSWVAGPHYNHIYEPSGSVYYSNNEVDQYYPSYSKRSEIVNYWEYWSKYPTDYRAWKIFQGTNEVASRLIYRGYHVKINGEDKLKINFSLVLENGTDIKVSEIPEYISGSDVGLTREITVNGLPAGHEVRLDLGGNSNDWSGTGDGAVQNGTFVQNTDGTSTITANW